MERPPCPAPRGTEPFERHEVEAAACQAGNVRGHKDTWQLFLYAPRSPIDAWSPCSSQLDGIWLEPRSRAEGALTARRQARHRQRDQLLPLHCRASSEREQQQLLGERGPALASWDVWVRSGPAPRRRSTGWGALQGAGQRMPGCRSGQWRRARGRFRQGGRGQSCPANSSPQTILVLPPPRPPIVAGTRESVRDAPLLLTHSDRFPTPLQAQQRKGHAGKQEPQILEGVEKMHLAQREAAGGIHCGRAGGGRPSFCLRARVRLPVPVAAATGQSQDGHAHTHPRLPPCGAPRGC